MSGLITILRFQNAVPDERDQQCDDHGAAEDHEAQKTPRHGLVPTMPNVRVDPSSSMTQCCAALWRVNGETSRRAALSGMGRWTFSERDHAAPLPS